MNEVREGVLTQTNNDVRRRKERSWERGGLTQRLNHPLPQNMYVQTLNVFFRGRQFCVLFWCTYCRTNDKGSLRSKSTRVEIKCERRDQVYTKKGKISPFAAKIYCMTLKILFYYKHDFDIPFKFLKYLILW